MTDGFGAITWWGFTPALDLQDQDVTGQLKSLSLDSSSQVLNVLLVGAGDCRHVLKTIAKSYKWQKRKINFYILENSLELYARDMLFLLLAYEPANRMGLQEKTELFLELFGNSLIRQQSLEYVERMANLCIKMVTDFDFLEKKFPLLDLSLLKFKERDFLEGIFKFWRNKSPFDVKAFWEQRLRHYLGVRYDCRKGVFDWDFSMKLVDRDAEIIHSKLYSWWRETGTAFEIREGSYDVSNLTLASGFLLKQGGEKVARRGYWGDIIVSPFIAFGIECEEKSFFKKSNNQLTKSSCDVSEYNILSMLHELATRSKYIPPAETKSEAEEAAGPKLTEITEEDEEEEEVESQTRTSNTEEQVTSNPLDTEYEPLPSEEFSICFLPLNSIGDLHKKARYQKLFHVAYFSNSMVHHLKPENKVEDTFVDNAKLILESTRFMLELKVDQNEEFVKRVTSMAGEIGCKRDGDCNPMKDSFINFTYLRKTASS